MPPQLAELNRRLLVSGGPGAFSCLPCSPTGGGGSASGPAVGGFPAGASAHFPQTPVQLVQLVRQGSRPSGELGAAASRDFAAAPARLGSRHPHAAQRDSMDAVSDPLSRLLGFK